LIENFNLKIKNYLERLRGMSDKNKKIILWTIVAVLAIIMGLFWIRGTMDSLSKLGNQVGEIKLPDIEMPQTEALDNLTGADQTNDWIKCVSDCDFYVDKVLGEIINKNCIDVCSGKYKIVSKYKYLDSSILFLSPEVKACNNLPEVSLKETCLYTIPQKYLINQ